MAEKPMICILRRLWLKRDCPLDGKIKETFFEEDDGKIEF
jgi:hypothetical protein